MEVEIEMESEIEKDLRRQRLREFYHLTHVMFTKPERLILYKILKDYHKRHDIERLIIGLNLILRTYTKLELLKYVRYFIWEGHIQEFDRLTKFHLRFRKRQKDKSISNNSLLQVPAAAERMSVTSTSTSGRKIKDVRVFTLVKEPGEESIGFSIRGGSEHGLGIYISDIDEGSAAENCGLQVGDKILEANNVSLKGVASSSAVKVLTSYAKVKLVVQRSRKVPEWRLSREKTSWVDVHDHKLISGEFEECGITHHIRGLEVKDPERRVSLKFSKADRTIGFNVRGGREYGLGIYVSKVDKDGLADRNGVRVGDQIIDVNGVPFDNITHTHAVEVLKGKSHLILTLKDVGRFPAFKELYAEYTWSDTQMRAASSMTGIPQIRIEDRDRPKSRSVSDLFERDRRPSVLQSEIFLPSEILPSTSRDNHDGDDFDSLSDLEHWHHSNNDLQYSNNGYESDVEPNIKQVTVHVEHTAHVTEINQRNTDDSENDMNERRGNDNEEIDNIYAQIRKVNVETDMILKDSEKGNFDEYDSVPHSSNKEYDVNRGSDKGRQGQAKYESRYSHITEVHSDLSLCENKIESDIHTRSDGEQIKTSTVSGNLYAKVKDIGRPSHKGYISHAHSSISQSNQGSTSSVNSDTSADEDNTARSQSNQQTLQIRGVKGNDSELSDDSDIETNTISKSGEYILNKENTNAYDLDSNKKKSSKGKGKKGSYNVTEDNVDEDNVDEENIEVRLRELQHRQTSIGLQELNALSHRNYDAMDSNTSRKSTWKSIKNKIKGSLRMKPPRRRELVLHKEKENTKKDITLHRSMQSLVRNTIDDYDMATFEEAASKMLTAEEYESIMKNVKMYHESHNLDAFVDMLLQTLDTPEKLLLLRDVRGIIYPLDIVRFDNRVNKYEIEAYQKLSMKLHLPLNHKQLKRPHKTIITTEIGKRRYKRKSVSFAKNPSSIPDVDVSLEDREAEDGHFHIRPLDQYEKQGDVVDIMRSHLEGKKQNSLSKKNSIGTNGGGIPDFYQSSAGIYLDNHSEYGSNGSGDNEKYAGSTIVHLSKNKPSIGIDLYETEEAGQKEVRIKSIDPNGAANDDNDIQVGMTLLLIDRHKVDGCSKEEVAAILQKCYADKQHVSMKLVLHKHQSTDF